MSANGGRVATEGRANDFSMDPTNLQAHGQQQKMRQQAAPRRYDGVNGNPLYDPANGGHYGMLLLASTSIEPSLPGHPASQCFKST